MTYVMFVLVTVGPGATSFQYEFKDKTQCENAIKTMVDRFQLSNFFYPVRAYCQEVKK